MYEYFWNEVLSFLKRSRGFRSASYEWSQKEKKFKTLIGNQKSRYKRQFRHLTWLCLGHQTVIFWNLLQAFRKEESFILKISGLWIASISMVVTVSRCIHYMKMDEITQFLNTASDHQNAHPNRTRGNQLIIE
jgi:hypothetical protein